MRTTQSAEVVVLGAGIAGLLMAGTLAKRHEVLVIEKSDRLRIEKYWLTDHRSVAMVPELVAALDAVYREIDFIAYEGTTFRARGQYHLWHSENLLKLLSERLARRGGRVLYGQQFYSVRRTSDGLTIFLNDHAVRCRIVIDCMGYASPIVQANSVMDVYGYYLLYGATFPLREALVPVALHNMMLSGQPGYIEAFPTTDGRLHIVLIVPVRQLGKTSDLKQDFAFIVSKSPYSRYIDSPVSPQRRFLGGIIPVGRMIRRALDRIFFFGEAGQVNPAASATALTRMLINHESISDHISERLAADALSAPDLTSIPRCVSRFNEGVQRALFKSILRWRSDDFRKVIDELNRVGSSDLLNALVFGDLPNDWRTLGPTVKRLWQTGSTTLLKAFVRGALPLT